ncbi:unnamed protein product, partial [Ixodes pacificus]
MLEPVRAARPAAIRKGTTGPSPSVLENVQYLLFSSTRLSEITGVYRLYQEYKLEQVGAAYRKGNGANRMRGDGLRDGYCFYPVANRSRRSGAHLLTEVNRKKRTACTSMPRTNRFTVCFVVCFHELDLFFFLLNSFCLSAPGASVYRGPLPRLFLRRFRRTFCEGRQCMLSA